MDRRKPGKRPSSISRPAGKRSSNAPLWESYEGAFWALGAAIVIGYPIVRDATADRMARNTYASASSCACAYSEAQCAPSRDRWVGPWYAVSPEDREPGDPGEGRSCRTGTGGGAYVYGLGRSEPDSGRTGVEKGYRGGFGATGRVRAAGS